MNVISKLKPIHVDIVGPMDMFSDAFNPISKDQRSIKYFTVVHFLSRAGYLYDEVRQEYYKLNPDGIYYNVGEEVIEREIYTLINIHMPDFNVEVRHVHSIKSMFKSERNTYTLSLDFSNFLKTDMGMDYEIDYLNSNNFRMIRLNNGIFNPCLESDGFPFKLLPHCGLYYPPEGSEPYDLDFIPIPESDLFSMPESEDFLKILGDKETLEFFLWWAGAVLFCPRFRLPCFVLLYGRGGSGKDSLCGCLTSILSSSSGSTPLASLSNPRSLAGLIGKRLNISAEMEGSYDKGLISSIKNLTGGPDIYVDPKFKSPRHISPPALIFSGNVFPDIDTSDTGILRRVCVIDCSANLEDDGVDWPILMRDNDHKNWLFNASYYYWTKNSDKLPHHMKSKSMRNMESRFYLYNPLSSWIFEKIGSLDKSTIRSYFVKKSLVDMYDDYRIFVTELGYKALGRNRFSERIQVDYGLKLTPIGNVRVFKLKDEV